MVHLRRLHEAYGEEVQFLLVVIRDAGHRIPEAITRAVEGPPAPGEPEDRRLRLLLASANYYGITFPCLLDGSGAEVEKEYTAAPLRLVLVDTSGRVALASGAIDPTDYWDDVETWLKEQVQQNDPRPTDDAR